MTTIVNGRYGFDESYVPVLRPDSLVRHYGNEGVAWSPAHGSPTYLDPVAASVLNILDGRASVGELIADVHDVLNVPREIASSQIGRVVRVFLDGGLLEGTVDERNGSPSSIFHDPLNT